MSIGPTLHVGAAAGAAAGAGACAAAVRAAAGAASGADAAVAHHPAGVTPAVGQYLPHSLPGSGDVPGNGHLRVLTVLDGESARRVPRSTPRTPGAVICVA